MLRPEQMSKVSVTGAKSVMDDVVEALHDLRLLHLSDYDGSWEQFRPGDPAEGADEASEKLVTVRSLESILGVDDGDAGPTRIVTDEAVETELAEIRAEVNELDDRREELEDELRSVEERLDTMAPFAELGLDLDLLAGYDTLQVAVGEGDEERVADALSAADAIDRFELFGSDGVVAVFAYPVEGAAADALTDALVGVEFSALDVPDVDELADEHGGELSPEAYIEEMRHRRQQLESRVDSVESELEDVKLDAAGFLLAVEERLTIDVQKQEAPLSFATTDRSFVAEGWVPTDRYDELETRVTEAVDGRVEVDELERVDPEEYAREHAHHGEEETAADGGMVTMGDEPPVVQDNPGISSPFELLVRTVGLPRYDEFDPTVVLFLTFPAFFGFMIGDLGYGLLYTAIGYALWSRFESPGIRSLGGVAMWAGGFTMLFGVLYGEVFGLHQLGELYGGPVVHKGLQPVYLDYAKTWIVLTVLAGIAHLAIAFGISFAKDLAHGTKDAVLESGSWLLMLFGFWGWILSDHLASPKPPFLVGPESVLNGHPLPLGFSGLPEIAGIVGLGMFVVGLVLIAIGDPVEFVEALFLQVFVNGLSYTRMAAVLLAKAGMAFVVNLLVFGVYSEPTPDGTAFHFLFFSDHFASPAAVEQSAHATLIFGGMVNADGGVALVVGWMAGLLILVVGHLVVLALGVTSAGLQAVRLEYVEFMNKFFEGGGSTYTPFGYERTYTTED